MIPQCSGIPRAQFITDRIVAGVSLVTEKNGVRNRVIGFGLDLDVTKSL